MHGLPLQIRTFSAVTTEWHMDAFASNSLRHRSTPTLAQAKSRRAPTLESDIEQGQTTVCSVCIARITSVVFEVPLMIYLCPLFDLVSATTIYASMEADLTPPAGIANCFADTAMSERATP